MKKALIGIVVAALIIVLGIYGFSSFTGQASAEIRDCLSQPGEDEDSCYAKAGIEKASLELCDKIDADGTKGFCYQGVASQLDDLSVCGLIEEEFWSSVCYGDFAIKRSDDVLCLKMGTIGERDRCLRSVANATINPDTCDIIGLRAIRGHCQWDVATQGENLTACEILEDSIDKALCKRFFAIQEQSYDVCNQIKTDKIRKECRFRVQEGIEGDIRDQAISEKNPELCKQIHIVSIIRACEEGTNSTQS